MKFLQEQSDNCRKYYRAENGKLYCIQDEGRKQFEFYECEPSGEPSHRVNMPSVFWRGHEYSDKAIPELLEALEQARAALPDAWFAHKDNVPKEVIELIDQAIEKAKWY